jgi:hypothetical protein
MKLICLAFFCAIGFSLYSQDVKGQDTCSVLLPKSISRHNEPNDFTLEFNCKTVKFKFVIYNRWGQEIFKTEQIESKVINWDRSKLASGAYVYIINYTVLQDGNLVELKKTGSLNLL